MATEREGLAPGETSDLELKNLFYYRHMPCDYEIDLVRRCVRCRAWGVVTYDEAMATRLKFTSEPSFAT